MRPADEVLVRVTCTVLSPGGTESVGEVLEDTAVFTAGDRVSFVTPPPLQRVSEPIIVSAASLRRLPGDVAEIEALGGFTEIYPLAELAMAEAKVRDTGARVAILS